MEETLSFPRSQLQKERSGKFRWGKHSSCNQNIRRENRWSAGNEMLNDWEEERKRRSWKEVQDVGRGSLFLARSEPEQSIFFSKIVSLGVGFFCAPKGPAVKKAMSGLTLEYGQCHTHT